MAVSKDKTVKAAEVPQSIAEELYKRNVELAVTNKTLSLLRKLYQISLLTLDPEKFNSEVSAAIRQELNFELVGVLKYDLPTDSLIPINFAKSDRLEKALQKESVALKDIQIFSVTTNKFFQKVVIGKEQNITKNITDLWDNLIPTEFVKRLEKSGHIQTFVAAPLINETKVFAVLVLGLNREYESLNAFEKDSINNFTDVIAVGLDRAYIYRELQEANEKLKSLDKLKSEFISLASHQLRTPLTAIKGYTSMILDGDYGPVTDKLKVVVDRVMKSSMNLSVMVEDFLNVSKIEQGGMKYEKVKFDLSEVTSAVSKDLAMIAENKGLKFSYTEDKGSHLVFADKEKIRQVILNFIDNSVKYTAKGSIECSLTNEKGKVRFAVKDTGMGMTPETKITLFQKFARGQGGKVNTTGSGLGLYLAREIVAAHEGNVGVDSPGLEKGSTFYVELGEAK